MDSTQVASLCCIRGSPLRARLGCSISIPFPALCPDLVLLGRIAFGQSPSLHRLRRGWRTILFVRRLLRYYEPVRLPRSVHPYRAPFGFMGRTESITQPVQGPPGSRVGNFRCVHGVFDHSEARTALAMATCLVLPSSLAHGVGLPHYVTLAAQ